MPFAIYDKEADVPDAQRDVYEEKDGKWHPKVPDVTNLRSALQTERERATEQERLRKAAEKERDDLRRAEKAKAAGISDDELQKLRDDEAKARKPLEDKIAEQDKRIRQLTLTDRVKALALAAGVMPDRIKQAMKILDERTDLTDADGIVVKDEDGKVTTETIDDFLAKTFKKESPWFYAGSGASGSGASGSSGSGGGTQTDTTTQAQALERKRQTMPGAI
jgi:hypothetical protein